MSDDCNVCKVNSTYLVLSKVNFQATVSPNLLLNIAPTKIWNSTIFLYTKPNSTSAIPNLFGFMQFVARSHLGNGIFANNNIWMKPQKVKIAEVHNEKVRQFWFLFLKDFYLETLRHTLMYKYKIHVQKYWSASVSPKIGWSTWINFITSFTAYILTTHVGCFSTLLTTTKWLTCSSCFNNFHFTS